MWVAPSEFRVKTKVMNADGEVDDDNNKKEEDDIKW